MLLLGPPGSGKSDLVLRLIARGWQLVADDQVEIAADLGVQAPAPLRTMLEVRGLGIFEGMEVETGARLRLVAMLAPRGDIARLPVPATWQGAPEARLPLIALDPFEASACAKLGFALDAATGRRRQRAGAFAA